jgi:mannitol/fructose-specific phosphotransferase system IIA component (Ntr-type)
MTDALAKLLIEKGVITDAEFKQKLLEACGLPAS